MNKLLEFYENNEYLLRNYDTDTVDTLYSLIEDIKEEEIMGHLYERCKEYYEKIDNAETLEQINLDKYEVLDLISGDVSTNICDGAICYDQLSKLLTEFTDSKRIFSLDHVKTLAKIYHNMTKQYRYGNKISVKWIDENLLQFVNADSLKKNCVFTYAGGNFILKSSYLENDLYTCSRHWKPPTVTEYNQADQPVLKFDEMFDFGYDFIK